MAYLTLNKSKLKDNFEFLKKKFNESGVAWGVVSKLLCGNRLFLQELINLGVDEVHDSRISNLAMVKKLNPEVQTVYIKPVSKRNVGKMVEFADVSLNSELETIHWISEEAVLQNKKHKIIIMVETGDLREGVMGEQLVDFYSEVFKLPNIEIIGLGTNLNCLNGVMPSTD
ncbi:alanine racemase, partial [uncultured Algoriphagus sp.]|nr:amino-acid racemase [Algoriphagus sp.]